jgi:ethanolamine utilization microcompartment shell protein EutS
MLPELVLQFITPAPRPLRRMGLVKDSVGLWSRGARRRSDWRPHEERCRRVVRRAVAGLSRRRTAVVLGSGLLRDVPLSDLVAAFARVVLVDAVHLPMVRLQVARRPAVSLVTRDLTGLSGWLSGEADGRQDPLADLVADPEVDFVLSANVLSQLPLGVETFLEKHPGRARALPADLADRSVGWHLADLARFAGHVCLLTDVEMREEDQAGRVTDRLDLTRGHPLPAPDESWDWPVAPFGELERDLRYVHRVHAYADWKRARAGATP